MELKRRKRINIYFGIAPLVDIVFLLLLFFLLTSQFIKPVGIKIELPKAKYVKPQDKIDIVVAITKDEELFLNGSPVTLDTLPSQLEKMFKNNPHKIVTIKADKGVKLQPVITIMDIARQCNAEGITISTRLKSE